MGVVLKQGHLVAYYSCAFNKDLWGYATYDKELYALYQAMKYWMIYLVDLYNF